MMINPPPTVIEPFEAAEAPYTPKFYEVGYTSSQQEETINVEGLKKEVIRQAMS